MFYPQLNERCLSQYPVKKTLKARTIGCETVEGARSTVAAPRAATYEWALFHRGLTLDEVSALQAFHTSVEGSLRAFSFIDPTGNILQFSEALTTAPWQVDPGLLVTPGQPDPLGGQSASKVINTTAGAIRISQVCPVPGEYTYCLSFWARAAGEQNLRAGWQVGGEFIGKEFRCRGQWQRYQVNGRAAATAPATTFHVEFGAGASIELFGLQAEGQIAASAYRKTYSESAVFADAHFVDDGLTVVATAAGEYSADVRIESAWKELG